MVNHTVLVSASVLVILGVIVWLFLEIKKKRKKEREKYLVNPKGCDRGCACNGLESIFS